jgi:ABC-type uncharacterized transport system permease subunit
MSAFWHIAFCCDAMMRRLSGAKRARAISPAMGINVPNALLIMLPYLLALMAVGGLVGRQMAPATLANPTAGNYLWLRNRRHFACRDILGE